MNTGSLGPPIHLLRPAATAEHRSPVSLAAPLRHLPLSTFYFLLSVRACPFPV
mgnify:CR=1 FL=1